MSHAGAFEMTLALLQVGQILGCSEEIVAFSVLVAFEPVAYGREQRFQHARDFGAALAACDLLDRMNIERALVRGFDLDIAAHKTGCGGRRPENPYGGLAQSPAGGEGNVTLH